MNFINPSHFFENTESFLEKHPNRVQLTDLMDVVKRNSCPDDLIAQVVNGAIAQEVNNTITPKERNVTVSIDGVTLPPMTEYNPTYNELIGDIDKRFEGLGIERAKGIVDALIRQQAIKVYDDGKLYRTKVLIPRLPLSI